MNDRKIRSELNQEIESHIQERIDELTESGIPESDARQQALREFGNVVRIQEDAREVWRRVWLDQFIQDLRYGLRGLLRKPSFTLVAILTLGIGIGAATVVFSQVNAVFWKRLPVQRPEQLRTLAWTSSKRSFVSGVNVLEGPRRPGLETFGSVSYPAYVMMRDRTTTFSDLACWNDRGEDRPVIVSELGFAYFQFVSGNYFRTLGVAPAAGRLIEPDDDVVGSPAVAVLSYPYWQRVFGGKLDAMGKPITINGTHASIIGVLPQGFFGVDPSITPDMMTTASLLPIASGTTNVFQNAGTWSVCKVVGRLRPGVSEEQARAETEGWIHETIRVTPPREDYDPPHLFLVDGQQGIATVREGTSSSLLILMGAVSIILLASCANVAGLLLVRGTARQREIATRLALGAHRSRLIRQLITESLLLSAIGGAVGVFFAYTLHRTTPGLLGLFMPTVYGTNRVLGVGTAPDLRVVLFAAIAAAATGLLFGILPAFRSTRLDLIAVMKQAASGRQNRWLGMSSGKVTVVVQTALSMVLLISAGLFIQTVINLRTADLGYQPDGLLYVKVEPRIAGYSPTQRVEFIENAVKKLEGTAGTEAVSAAAFPYLSGGLGNIGIGVDQTAVCTESTPALTGRERTVSFNPVLPHFFDVMRLPILRGRDFTWTDRTERGPFVVIINQALANKFFPGVDPVGQRMRVLPRNQYNCAEVPAIFTVVGLVADGKTTPRQEASPTLFVPLQQPPLGTAQVLTIVLRPEGGPLKGLPMIRTTLKELDSKIPLFGDITPGELRDQQIKQERVLTGLLTFFGIIILLLSCIGTYGLLAYTVKQKTAEIGLRMSLGARPVNVVAMIVMDSLWPVAVGIGLGVVAALGGGHWLRGVLFGISETDPITIGAAALLFLTTAAVASAPSALRASRIDPVRALRHE